MYHLDNFVEKIESPIVCAIEDAEYPFVNGKELSQHYFAKNYYVQSLKSQEGYVILKLAESSANDINFHDPEQASFF